jgi:carboxyl-terminal processing protease
MEYMKFREKDNPYALPWDTIESAKYNVWTEAARDDKLLAAARRDVAGSSTFNKIRELVGWLEKYNDKEYPLEFGAYRDEQKETKSVFKQMDSLYKLTEPLLIFNNSADSVSVNNGKDKVEKNKQWLKRVSEDVYVDEATRILGEMIRMNKWSGTGKN